jgi:hypothetical protein
MVNSKATPCGGVQRRRKGDEGGAREKREVWDAGALWGAAGRELMLVQMYCHVYSSVNQ